jgi:hypothetical protein
MSEPAEQQQEAAGPAARPSRTVCVQDPATTMVAPDTMTPFQYYDRIFAEASLVPEKRLMLAVLEDAIAAFQRAYVQPDDEVDGKPSEQDVEIWLKSRDISWPFSFESICQALDMEAEYLRNGLLRWRDKAQRDGAAGQVYRFPFRRVNGRRHSINAKRERKRNRKTA